MVRKALITAVIAVTFCYAGDGVMRGLQDALDDMDSFKADFTQKYVVEALDTVIVEKGKVSLKKPGLMRWEYRDPDEKLFLSDGGRTYFYVPEDKQVVVGSYDALKEQSAIVLILAGREDIDENYEIEVLEESGELYKLRFNPETDGVGYPRFLLDVEKEDFLIRRIAYLDSAENLNEILFDDVKRNVKFGKDHFTFNIPEGVEIIEQADIGR